MVPKGAFISGNMSSGTINDIVVHIVTPEPKLQNKQIGRNASSHGCLQTIIDISEWYGIANLPVKFDRISQHASFNQPGSSEGEQTEEKHTLCRS